MIRIGDVLREKYRLESSIGKGGMGEVFCAVDLQTLRRVAIKIVSRALIGELLMARLQREAIAAVRVRSEYVPQLLDVDTTEDGEVFLVMELLRGQTLAERLKQRRHLHWEEVAHIGSDVLHGLVDAHAAGVIHRDLKPSNIFIEDANATGHERARILDFGVCKLDAPDGENLTTTGEAVGTVAYMAPEQIRGASRVDQRADLYSFAMVIFEALSGRLAHDASGQMAMIASKLERAPLRLAQCALVKLPSELDPLVTRTLSRDPEGRAATATELLLAWDALGPATVEPRTLPIVEMGEAGPSLTQTGLTAATTGGRQGRAQSRLPLVVAVGAMAMSVGVLGAMVSVRAVAGSRGSSTVDGVVATPGNDPTAATEAPPTDPDPPVPGPVLGPGAAPTADTTPDEIELPGDIGQTTARPPHHGPGRPRSTGTKHGGEQPRIVDRPRY